MTNKPEPLDLDLVKAFYKSNPNSLANGWALALIDEVERLREPDSEGLWNKHIARVDALEAKNARLKEALRPFANVAQKVLELTDDHWDAYVTLNGTDSIKSFHRDVFRNASRAFGGKDND